MSDHDTLSLIGALELRKSKKQINADMKRLEKAINMLRITGTFTKGQTKNELNSYIKVLQSQLGYVKLHIKIDKKRIAQEIDSALGKMQWKEIDALSIDESKVKLKIRKAIAGMRAYADKIPMRVDMDDKRKELSNDLSTYLENNVKISGSPILEEEAEKVRELINTVHDKESLREAVDAIRLFQSEVSAAGLAAQPTADNLQTLLTRIAKIPAAFGAATLAVSSLAKALKTLRSKETMLPEITVGLPEAADDSLPDIVTRTQELLSAPGKTEQLDVWDDRIQSLHSSWDSFMDALANKELVVNGVSFFDSLMQGAESLMDTIGEVPVALAAINTAMAVKDKRYGITQLVNPETKKTDIQGNMFGIDLTAIKAQKKHFAEAGEAIEEWNEKLNIGQTDMNDFGNAAVKSNAQLREYLGTCSKEAPGSLAGYKAHLNAAGISTDALRLKTILLNTAIGIGVGIAVQAAVQGLTYLIQREENVRQATEQAANGYKETSLAIEDYVSKYQELREALLMAVGNEEETYRIKKQLLELQTELNEKFGDEYGAINLVAKAYQDQTESIQALNKEAAQTFLNENRGGIHKAERKMTKERHYNLAYTGLSSYTDKGKAIMEIAQKYEEQGITLLDEYGDGSYLQFSVHLNADAQSAYKTINAFENDLRERARELGDENMFDDVLDISSNALNRAKKVIDKYADIYNQSLAAEIASDDYKAIVYNDAIKAVQEYNEAVMMSENPHDDQNVEQAKQNLDAIKASIQGNEEEWGKYAVLLDDIFAQADTDLQSFHETLETDHGLGRLAEKLDGLSDHLSPTISASVKQMAEQLEPQFARLGEAYNEIFQFDEEGRESDGLRNIDNSMLEGLRQAFAEIKEETGVIFDAANLDSFFDALMNGSATTEQAQQAFNDLATAYLYSTDTLALLNSETESAITKQLEEMGVQNAAEIVASELAAKTEELAVAKEYLALTGDELALATDNEANAFILEQIEAGNCGEALALLQLKKMLVNNTLLDTSIDINNVLALAQAAGITSDALAKIASLQSEFNRAQAVGDYGAMNIISDEMAKAKLQLETDISNFKPVEVRFDSTSAVESAKGVGREAGKEAGRSYKDALEEELRGLDSVISGVTKAIDGQISSINSQKDA
ncbi:MAG: hypothetical protein K2P65_00060, partial [Lachnospiraceae bacterium]|nr:hypothetical protein [Lachnospiraceae bacterium]